MHSGEPSKNGGGNPAEPTHRNVNARTGQKQLHRNQSSQPPCLNATLGTPANPSKPDISCTDASQGRPETSGNVSAVETSRSTAAAASPSTTLKQAATWSQKTASAGSNTNSAAPSDARTTHKLSSGALSNSNPPGNTESAATIEPITATVPGTAGTANPINGAHAAGGQRRTRHCTNNNRHPTSPYRPASRLVPRPGNPTTTVLGRGRLDTAHPPEPQPRPVNPTTALGRDQPDTTHPPEPEDRTSRTEQIRLLRRVPHTTPIPAALVGVPHRVRNRQPRPNHQQRRALVQRHLVRHRSRTDIPAHTTPLETLALRNLRQPTTTTTQHPQHTTPQPSLVAGLHRVLCGVGGRQAVSPVPAQTCPTTGMHEHTQPATDPGPGLLFTESAAQAAVRPQTTQPPGDGKRRGRQGTKTKICPQPHHPAKPRRG